MAEIVHAHWLFGFGPKKIVTFEHPIQGLKVWSVHSILELAPIRTFHHGDTEARRTT